jgi:23S rRNA pseudouridine1911/1915/1917 synthase
MNEVTGIKIIYEDDDILIVDKPAGMTVNRAETTRGEVTVQDWMEEKFYDLFELDSRLHGNDRERGGNDKEVGGDDDFYNRGGVVHRLDKETSGVLILAKTPEAFVELQRQFKERIIKKVYVALAHGKIVPEEGEIKAPVGRLPWNRMQFGIVAGGRDSVTFYRALDYYRGEGGKLFTLVELNPKTGRTHQIRVHLKYIGYPIFADFLYAGRKTARGDRRVLGRVFLHAGKVSFIHPETGKEVEFESPLREELAGTLTRMEKV